MGKKSDKPRQRRNDGRKKPSSTTKPESVTAEATRSSPLKFALMLLVLCGIGFYVAQGSEENPKGSDRSLSEESSEYSEESSQYSENEIRTASAPTVTPQLGIFCDEQFYISFPTFRDPETLENSLILHRNGEATPCGQATVGSFVKKVKENYVNAGCPEKLDKYEFESFLTVSLYDVLDDECYSTESYGNKATGFLGYCDMGEDHTPILLDHEKLVKVKYGRTLSLPCHFHTREGSRITQSQVLADRLVYGSHSKHCEGDETTQTCGASKQDFHLYAVPAGRVFMFAPSYVGEIFHLPHVPGASMKPIYLEVLSLEPRVFDVFNFFNRKESKELVDRAIAEKSESHRIKRSTTGASDKAVNSRRTSESGFDTSGKTALKIKRRCFNALGFDEYIEAHSDGLQILRYNVSKAYNSHLDWIEDTSGQLKHDYESAGTGGNRFATILLYMTDLGENDGGETVFPHGTPHHIPEEERISKKEALEQLRNSEQGSVLKAGSWEEKLVATCRSKLAVRPHSSRAVLFYSQHPNGEVDKSSLHGACPVLSNQKYAANLWVWNTPRTGFAGSPIKKKFQGEHGATVKAVSNGPMKISATFGNSGEDPTMNKAKLYYEDSFWGDLGPNHPKLSVNTYEGHVWNVKVDGKIVKTMTIKEKNGKKQNFML